MTRLLQLIGAMTLLLGVAVAAPPASAGDYDAPTIGAEVLPGGGVRISGTGCNPNEQVDYSITADADGSQVDSGSTVSDADGAFFFDTFLDPGSYRATVTCGDLTQVLDFVVPGDRNELTLSAIEAATCSTGSAEARTFEPGSTVTFTLESDPVFLTSATAGADGTVTATYSIPADTTAGAHEIVATGNARNGGTLELRADLQISGNSCPTNSFLPRTGLFAGDWVRYGAAAVAFGTLFVYAGRKRRARAARL